MGKTEGETGSCSDRRAMLSKSLIQFSVDGWGCVPSLLFDLRPNYDRGNEDNVNLLQKVLYTHCSTQCPQPCSSHRQPMPLPETPGHSQTSLGQSLVGSLLLSPGSCCAWGFVCALQESVSQSCVSSGGSMVGLMAISSKKAYATPRSAAPRAPAPVAGHSEPYLHKRHSNTVLSQSLWGLWVLMGTRFVWALQASLVGIGFDSKCNFTPPSILLGLLLCPWTWGIFLGGIFQDGGVEGRVLTFSCKNSKITTHCWTTIDRRLLDPTKERYPTSNWA